MAGRAIELPLHKVNRDLGQYGEPCQNGLK
jgi:hypothetical protein